MHTAKNYIMLWLLFKRKRISSIITNVLKIKFSLFYDALCNFFENRPKHGLVFR